MPGISGGGIVEYKCPLKGGYPSHYKQIPASDYIQMQLKMKATNSDRCHFVSWTHTHTGNQNMHFAGKYHESFSVLTLKFIEICPHLSCWRGRL